MAFSPKKSKDKAKPGGAPLFGKASKGGSPLAAQLAGYARKGKFKKKK